MPAKRALSAALALLLAVSFAAPSGARAASDGGFEYTLTGSDATVTGCTGTCPTTLVIPATLGGYSVTAIGAGAWSNLDVLITVTIPNSVTYIGGDAFRDNRITSLTIGNSVTTIGYAAFANNRLTTVTIPSSVTSIGAYAFYGNFLTSVTFLGDAPTAVASNVFDSNSGLTFVRRLSTATGWGSTWSDVAVVTVPVLSDNGFFYFQISGAATITGCDPTCPTTLDIPVVLGGYYVTTIGSEAFNTKSLVALTIPSTVTSIGYSAFANNLLTTVTIPNSVMSIGYTAFYNNALTSVTIPNSVTSIGDSAFWDNALTSVTIPNSVTSIGDGAFAYNALTSVTIPNSVTSIGDSAFANNRLTTVTIGNSVTTIDDFAFDVNLLTSVTFLGDAPIAGNNVFSNNSGLTSVKRPYTATGWGSTWSGVAVVIADARATATVKPTVTGTSTVGRTLTAAKGTWTGYPTPTFTYQWYACTTAVSVARTTVPSTCKKITGATKSTFKLTSTQRGKYVAVFVKGTSLRTTATTWLSKTTAKVK